MSANMTPPQQPPPQVAPAQPQAAATAAMPWDQLDEQLRQLVAQEGTATAAIAAAASAYNAIKDAPTLVPDALPPRPGEPDPQAGAVSAEAKTQALNAYVAATAKLTELKQQEAAVAGDIATAKQKYQDAQAKLNPTPEERARTEAETASATAQAGYYDAQAKEAQARADYLTSPEGKAKDAAAAKLDVARADTEKAQQGLYAAQQGETAANAALLGAKAAAYPAESAAAVGANVAGAAANEAQAAQIRALIAAGMPAAQAATVAAQGKASEAEAALHEEELRQKRLGDLGAFIDGLATAQKAGLIDQATAERMVKAKEQETLTGATAFDRSKQADTVMTTLANQALQSGNAVRPDQQYIVGGGPGGDIQRMLGTLGIQYTPERLQPATMPAYAAGLGVTTPAGVAAANGVPAYAAGLMGPPAGLPDLSHLTPDQAHAALTGAAQAPVNSPTPSTASLFPGNVPPDAPPGTVAGGVNKGLLLTAPIVGAPNYARPAGT